MAGEVRPNNNNNGSPISDELIKNFLEIFDTKLPNVKNSFNDFKNEYNENISNSDVNSTDLEERQKKFGLIESQLTSELREAIIDVQSGDRQVKAVEEIGDRFLNFLAQYEQVIPNLPSLISEKKIFLGQIAPLGIIYFDFKESLELSRIKASDAYILYMNDDYLNDQKWKRSKELFFDLHKQYSPKKYAFVVVQVDSEFCGVENGQDKTIRIEKYKDGEKVDEKTWKEEYKKDKEIIIYWPSIVPTFKRKFYAAFLTICNIFYKSICYGINATLYSQSLLKVSAKSIIGIAMVVSVIIMAYLIGKVRPLPKGYKCDEAFKIDSNIGKCDNVTQDQKKMSTEMIEEFFDWISSNVQQMDAKYRKLIVKRLNVVDYKAVHDVRECMIYEEIHVDYYQELITAIVRRLKLPDKYIETFLNHIASTGSKGRFDHSAFYGEKGVIIEISGFVTLKKLRYDCFSMAYTIGVAMPRLALQQFYAESIADLFKITNGRFLITIRGSRYLRDIFSYHYELLSKRIRGIF